MVSCVDTIKPDVEMNIISLDARAPQWAKFDFTWRCSQRHIVRKFLVSHCTVTTENVRSDPRITQLSNTPLTSEDKFTLVTLLDMHSVRDQADQSLRITHTVCSMCETVTSSC